MAEPVWGVIVRSVVLALLAAMALAPAETAAAAEPGHVPQGWVLRVDVPEAVGGKTVIGQLTVDHVADAGFVTAYGCDDGLPQADGYGVSRSDLNFEGGVSRVASNRLIVEADDDGEVCFYTSATVDMIIDLNAVSFDTGITSFPNRRTDTRTGSPATVEAGDVLRVGVPEAIGGKTVIGQLTVDHAVKSGFVTAYGCDDGLPRTPGYGVSRSDLNYDSGASPVASNRLIVEADDDGDVCFYTSATVDMIIDLNGASDTGITSFPNRRTDTRTGSPATVTTGGVLRVRVPEAIGRKTVIGQLTVDHVADAGFVTAYGCDDGLPQTDGHGVSRSDLNYDGGVSAVASNRLIVEADDDGEVCFYTSATVDMIIDLNGASDTGITSFPNRRTDTRTGSDSGTITTPSGANAPEWPTYQPLPALDGVAALTGAPADATIAQRPIVAVKIDNYRLARPQWGLDEADAIIEQNAEGVTRFIALFHTRMPTALGPVRSARTGDLDLLAAMNRPTFAYSGANPGVTAWIDSAASSGVVVDFTAQANPCFAREPGRPGPHNLSFDSSCAVDTATTAGPARSLWSIDPAWTVPAGMTAGTDTTFSVQMGGVGVGWTWDAATGSYLRTQDGGPHLAASGQQISAHNVVEVSTVYMPSPVDARSPHPITVGSGAAVVHRDGRAIAATWSRPTAYDPFEFFEAHTGLPVPLDGGTTFMELVSAR